MVCTHSRVKTERPKQFARIAEPMRPTWPQPTTVSVAIGSTTTHPPPLPRKGCQLIPGCTPSSMSPVFNWVKRNKRGEKFHYCLRKKRAETGWTRTKQRKLQVWKKINRSQRNPVLCVITGAQGLTCEVCHIRLTPTPNVCLRGACTLCNMFTANHINQQFA